MRRTRTVLASSFVTLVLTTGASAQTSADECLAKPSGPTPQGQHWYYRIDHANNGRQCWYLREKTSRQTERIPTDAMAQAIQAPAAAPKESAAPATAPIPWLNMQTLPAPISPVRPVAQQEPTTPAQSNDESAITPSGNTMPERTIGPPNVVPGGPAP